MKKRLIISFIIALVYVSLGTLVGISIYPKYFIWGFGYDHPLWFPLLIITLPANFILLVLLMISDSIFSIFVSQSIIFLILWFLVYKMINKK